jgi:hypothetical protein
MMRLSQTWDPIVVKAIERIRGWSVSTCSMNILKPSILYQRLDDTKSSL